MQPKKDFKVISNILKQPKEVTSSKNQLQRVRTKHYDKEQVLMKKNKIKILLIKKMYFNLKKTKELKNVLENGAEKLP